MKFFLKLFLVGLIVPINGAVIFELRNEMISAGTPDNRLQLDFDEDGVNDWRIQATFQSSIASFYEIRIDAFETTQFLYETESSEMRFEGLKDGAIIGPESESESLTFSSLWLNSAPTDLAASIPLAGLNPKPSNFVGETSYLGFRFESDEGTHYGYALFTDTAVNRTTLVATAWETEPGKGIVAGAIPEPSTGLLLLFAASILCRKKR